MLYVTSWPRRTIDDALIEFRDKLFDPRSERALWCASREAAAILETGTPFESRIQSPVAAGTLPS
jgi:hypothetical protein